MCGRVLQEKEDRLGVVEQTLQEMAEVDTWQAEVGHLDRCLAWVPGVQLRARRWRQRPPWRSMDPASCRRRVLLSQSIWLARGSLTSVVMADASLADASLTCTSLWHAA